MRHTGIVAALLCAFLVTSTAHAAVYIFNAETFDPETNYSDQPTDDTKKSCALTSGDYWLCHFTVNDNGGSSNTFFVTANVRMPATHTDNRTIRFAFDGGIRFNIGDGLALTIDGSELVLTSNDQTTIQFIATNGVGAGTLRLKGAITTYQDVAGNQPGFGIDNVWAASVKVVFENVSGPNGSHFLARNLTVRNLTNAIHGLEISGSKIDFGVLNIFEGSVAGTNLVGIDIHSNSEVHIAGLTV